MSGKKFTFDGLKSDAPINISESNSSGVGEASNNAPKARKKAPKKKAPGRPVAPEKKPTIQTSIRLHPDLKGVAKRIAEIRGIEVYSVYNEMIADYLAKYKKKYPPFFDHFKMPDKKEL